MKLPIKIAWEREWGEHFVDAEGDQVPLEKILAALNADRWIPVTEQLPDDDVSVMIALQGEHGEPVWIGFHDETGWRSATDASPLGDMVTHWKNIEAGPHG